MKRIILSIFGIVTFTTASAVVGGMPNIPTIKHNVSNPPAKISHYDDFYFNYGRGVDRVEFHHNRVEEGCYQGVAKLSHGSNGYNFLHAEIPVSDCHKDFNNSQQVLGAVKSWLLKDWDNSRPVNYGSSYLSSELTDNSMFGFTHLKAKNLLPLLDPANIFVTGKLYINGSPMKGDFALFRTLLGMNNYNTVKGVKEAWAWSVRNDINPVTLKSMCDQARIYSGNHNICAVNKSEQTYAMNDFVRSPFQLIANTRTTATDGWTDSYITKFDTSKDLTGQHVYATLVQTEDGKTYGILPEYDTHSIVIFHIN